MASADILISPHRVNDFTLSLDAIKSFEYLVSGRPVVATPTSGFQRLESYETRGVYVVDSEEYVARVAALARRPWESIHRRGWEHDWSARARTFAAELSSARQALA
jgi:glycosyltransferase involved in cell wall biosynthesis